MTAIFFRDHSHAMCPQEAAADFSAQVSRHFQRESARRVGFQEAAVCKIVSGPMCENCMNHGKDMERICQLDIT